MTKQREATEFEFMKADVTIELRVNRGDLRNEPEHRCGSTCRSESQYDLTEQWSSYNITSSNLPC